MAPVAIKQRHRQRWRPISRQDFDQLAALQQRLHAIQRRLDDAEPGQAGGAVGVGIVHYQTGRQAQFAAGRIDVLEADRLVAQRTAVMNDTVADQRPGRYRHAVAGQIGWAGAVALLLADEGGWINAQRIGASGGMFV